MKRSGVLKTAFFVTCTLGGYSLTNHWMGAIAGACVALLINNLPKGGNGNAMNTYYSALKAAEDGKPKPGQE